jgi:hypothetical protein
MEKLALTSLLQQPNVTTGQDVMLQYGVLGVLSVCLGYFAYNQYTRLLKKNDDLEKKVDKLQNEMMTLLVEERERMSQLVKENTQALISLQNLIYQTLVAAQISIPNHLTSNKED